MAAFDLFSIGHSNIAAERFVAMLQSVGAVAVADVRSVPASRHFPWFSRKNLTARLAAERLVYLPHGGALGGRPSDPLLYRDGVADYEAMARQPDYQADLDRLIAASARQRICLMCAEREPLDCHRCLLVARSLSERGLAVGHILHDGTIEPHRATEQRLLALNGDDGDLFAAPEEALAAAYRVRSRAVAYRLKPAAPAAPASPS